jgi:hypothetical protein
MFYHIDTQTFIPENSSFNINGTQYPQNWLNLSTPDDKIEHGIFEVTEDPAPPYNPITEYITENPILLFDGKVIRNYTINTHTQEIIDHNITRATEAFTRMVVDRVQIRLDEFARTRNYDGILSVCTYATSVIPRFQIEGQYCVNARDNTWATLYTLMEEVTTGVREPMVSYEEVEALLPELTWPA